MQTGCLRCCGLSKSRSRSSNSGNSRGEVGWARAQQHVVKQHQAVSQTS